MVPALSHALTSHSIIIIISHSSHSHSYIIFYQTIQGRRRRTGRRTWGQGGHFGTRLSLTFFGETLFLALGLVEGAGRQWTGQDWFVLVSGRKKEGKRLEEGLGFRKGPGWVHGLWLCLLPHALVPGVCLLFCLLSCALRLSLAASLLFACLNY